MDKSSKGAANVKTWRGANGGVVQTWCSDSRTTKETATADARAAEDAARAALPHGWAQGVGTNVVCCGSVSFQRPNNVAKVSGDVGNVLRSAREAARKVLRGRGYTLRGGSL